MKNTKIVATIGPAAESVKELSVMIEAGMNVCRLNFSHGDYLWHKNAVRKIRLAEKRTGKKVGIMADIQGPRVRVANKRTLLLRKSEKVFITDQKSPASHQYKKELILDWDGFYFHVKRGDRIFIEDGIFDLEVIRKEKHGCVAKVLIGGKVSPHKGVNIPEISRHLGFLTDKDLADLEFIVSQDVDFVAASFVRSGEDIMHLRRIIGNFMRRQNQNKENKQQKPMPWIVSKIERKKAIENIESIVEESDGIMVARGDLAIEVSQEKMAILQKDIVRKCLAGRKPVIVATQMMASMVKNVRPTRAEISDISNAVIDHADAIMFSNETATGKNPLRVIETASGIIEETEKSQYDDVGLKLINRFARMISRAKKSRKARTIKAKSLEEFLEYSTLRQEGVKISLDSKIVAEKRRVSLIWGG